MKIFSEYRDIINQNLNDFLKEILNISRDNLTILLSEFEHTLDYKDVQYLLAGEDYEVFHEYMFEANRIRSARVL